MAHHRSRVSIIWIQGQTKAPAADTTAGSVLPLRVMSVKLERTVKDEVVPARTEPLAPPNERQVPPHVAAPTLYSATLEMSTADKSNVVCNRLPHQLSDRTGRHPETATRESRPPSDTNSHSAGSEYSVRCPLA
jgi:hypothetical protein